MLIMYKRTSAGKGIAMKYKFNFSIIELLTVVLIILLLISLIVPTFVNLKMQARSSICKSQLRQIGLLITSYVSAYDGYLPNDNAGGQDGSGNKLKNDLGNEKSKWENNEFYKNWNGHLLPFIDTPLKSFAREVKVSIDGEVRWADRFGPGAWDYSISTKAPSDPLKSGWVVVNDAYTKGGYGDLKTFICPEIHANVYDVRASNATNGKRFPRIKLADYCGFEQNNGNYLGNSFPTTYLANDYFFGKDGYYNARVDSLRIDDINEVSKKVFLIEGGICFAANNWSSNEIYFGGGNRTNYYDLVLNAFENSFNSGGWNTKTSFVHDNKDCFWTTYMPGGDGMWVGSNIALEFNEYFSGKAYMLPNRNINNSSISYQIVSFVYPDKGAIFKSWFDSKGITNQLTNYATYNEPENSYLTGSANLLFGDNSVMTKEQSWVYNNRNRIAQKTTE